LAAEDKVISKQAGTRRYCQQGQKRVINTKLSEVEAVNWNYPH
jgi:hypothetical protein